MLTAPKSEPLLRIEGLTKTYSQGRWWEKRFDSKALDGVDLTLEAGKTLALVGKSGSGKTTLAMCVAMLEKPDSGKIWFDGCELLSLPKSERAVLRPRIQLIFQDSAAALPTRFSAAQIIEEPLVIKHRGWASARGKVKERSALVLELMARVGLPPGWANRRPHQFSGGERQRLAIARSLALQPSLLILDEPFTGLDLSVRGQIVNLLLALQADLSLTFLYISHDLDLLRHFSDRVAVMDRGRIVEQASVTDLFRSPTQAETHPLLTQALLACRGMRSHG
ncbi:MAG: dipeptide/oligopeptide/nickel ABC transporter ATP-binding protein [Candidatus Sulfotelmatobacter sp.]